MRGVTPTPTPMPVMPSPVGRNLVAVEKFVEPIQITEAQNVLKFRLELAEECDVLIRADSSISANANVRMASTGFLNEQDPKRRWQGSTRRMSVKTDC